MTVDAEHAPWCAPYLDVLGAESADLARVYGVTYACDETREEECGLETAQRCYGRHPRVHIVCLVVQFWSATDRIT